MFCHFVQALDAAKLIDAIPDPGAQPLTFFAPVNGAFYDVMTNAGAKRFVPSPALCRIV